MPPRTCLIVLGLLLMAPAACVETRVVRYDPILGGLPGVQSGTPIVGTKQGYVDPTAVPEDQLVVTDPDTGQKKLTAKTARHLMIHIYNTIKDEDKETFVREVLSTKTRQECYDRGVDPGELFDELIRRREDLMALFNIMPAGEKTPGALLQPLGGKEYRVMVQGLATRNLTWTGMDMVMEKGNWKLRWFYTPPQ